MEYNRILLKLSGESLSGSENYGIDEKRLNEYCQQIAEILMMGIEVGIVIGGGNIFRGVQGTDKGFDRATGDYMGMLSTVINGLAFHSGFNNISVRSKIFTAFKIEHIGEIFTIEKAIASLSEKTIGIYTCGTGNPYFTTDTAAALRSVEIKADILLKGTRVDGIYSADPEEFSDAIRYDEISFNEAYEKKLKIMDMTAFTLCRDNNMPVLVFDMNRKNNLKAIVSGEKIGTLVRNF
ncbi:MAG: UMP kinase [Bacteroidia bacterium]|nr:UMP kinase [Bacteroidia bacterium]